MTLAEDSSVTQGIPLFEKTTFTGLDKTERRILLDWLARESGHTIDTVVDLKDRPWQVGGLDVVIGVFESGATTASHLLVRYQSRWVVAMVSEHMISAVFDDLGQALCLISGL